MRRAKVSSAGYTFQSFTASEQLPAAWNEFIPEGHFLKPAQLQASELSSLPGIRFSYILAVKNGQPVAATYFQLLSLGKQHINSKLVTPLQSTLWFLFTTVARPKLLVAGHLFRHDIASFYWHSDLSAFDAYLLYNRIIDIALKQSSAMAVLLKDAAPEFTTYFQHLSPQFIFLRNDISMELDIPPTWKTMEDYERALKHKYAQKFRKVRSAWNNVEVRELSEAEVAANKERLYWLYNHVTANQQVRLGLLSPEFMVEQKRFYKDNLRIWGIYEAGAMIGFYSAWVKGDVFDMFYIGFDYARNADLQLYFNILFFGIEQAIHFGKRKLILGRTALDAKARLGCTPHYLSTFLYIKNRFLRNRVLLINTRNSVKEGAWEERHPFKHSAQQS